MNNHPSATATLLRRLPAAAVVCLLPACGPDEPAVTPRAPFRAPPPETRKTDRPARENSLWLQAWRDLRERIQPLTEQMLELQKFFAENNLDPLLELDPATLETDRLCSLFHFLERGCFTVEREILVELLERRLTRPQTALSAADGRRLRLKDHLAAAMQRDEQRLMDIESAIVRYQAVTGGDFHIPESLTPEELYELRTTVRRMMDETRHAVDQLDARIASLQAQLNPALDDTVRE
jgi:hypothetical protein